MVTVCRQLPPEALPKLLELAAALGSSWRPTPAVALTLAELHLDRAVLCGPAAATAAPAEGFAAKKVGEQISAIPLHRPCTLRRACCPVVQLP